jgi:lysozyme family protein
MLQEIVGAVPCDGWIGAETLRHLALFASTALVMLIGARFAQIEDHIRQCPDDAEYRPGWRNRNASFLPKR